METLVNFAGRLCLACVFVSRLILMLQITRASGRYSLKRRSGRSVWYQRHTYISGRISVIICAGASNLNGACFSVAHVLGRALPVAKHAHVRHV